MKSVAQLTAEHNANQAKFEEQYLQVKVPVEKSLRKAMAIRGAFSTYELKLQSATAELEQELQAIDENFAQNTP